MQCDQNNLVSKRENRDSTSRSSDSEAHTFKLSIVTSEPPFLKARATYSPPPSSPPPDSGPGKQRSSSRALGPIPRRKSHAWLPHISQRYCIRKPHPNILSIPSGPQVLRGSPYSAHFFSHQNIKFYFR